MYVCRFRFRHTAADAADSACFAMRNPTGQSGQPKIVTIRHMILRLGFDGVSAVSHVSHALSRFTVANPTGGTSPARIHTGGTTRVTSVIADANIKDGGGTVLTLTSAVFEGNFHEIALPSVAGSVTTDNIDFPDGLRLEVGEGLVIRTGLIAVAGATISGSVWWSEE